MEPRDRPPAPCRRTIHIETLFSCHQPKRRLGGGRAASSRRVLMLRNGNKKGVVDTADRSPDRGPALGARRARASPLERPRSGLVPARPESRVCTAWPRSPPTKRRDNGLAPDKSAPASAMSEERSAPVKRRAARTRIIVECAVPRPRKDCLSCKSRSMFQIL
jgi:hypothetical protein